jgi:DNA-binding MarR family transcriptional regulator
LERNFAGALRKSIAALLFAAVTVPDATDRDLGSQLERRVAELWWALMRESPSDLSRTAASVLARLNGEGPQRVTVLALSEHVAQPSMSLLLQRLVSRGFVERRHDPEDRRASRIAITDAGRQVMTDRAEARSRWLRDRLARLDDTDRGVLRRAVELLDTLLADDPRP